LGQFLAGGVLGFIAGLLQMWANDAVDSWIARQNKKKLQQSLVEKGE
jgi:hypothetical protein